MKFTDLIIKKVPAIGENYFSNTYHALTSAEGDISLNSAGKLNKKWYDRVVSMHRLYNAAGMFAFFMIGGYIRDIMRGFDEKGQEIKQEDVLLVLKPLHGVLHHNPHSDNSRDQWMKVISRLVPACFAATGAVLGSLMFFKKNGREQVYKRTLDKAKQPDGKLNLFEASDVASYAQSWPMRIMAGLFATFSSASGLTIVYGLFLNAAFSLSTNRKMFGGAAELTGWNGFRHASNTTGSDMRGVPDSIQHLVTDTKDCLMRWQREMKVNPNFNPEQDIKRLEKYIEDNVIKQTFGGLAKNEEEMRAVREKITGFFNKVASRLDRSGKDPETALKNATNMLAGAFHKIDKDGAVLKDLDQEKIVRDLFHNEFGISKETIANAEFGKNGLGGWVADKVGHLFGRDKVMTSISDSWKRQVNDPAFWQGGRSV